MDKPAPRVADLLALYDYCSWANRKLLTVVATLTPAEFTATVGGSYGSVRHTLVHILSAEWGWLERCGGKARGDRLKPDDYPTADSVVEIWEKVEKYSRAFLATLDDQDLSRAVQFSIGEAHGSMALGDMLTHALLHGIHHRGQVALLVRMLGRAPGNFDFLFFAAAPHK